MTTRVVTATIAESGSLSDAVDCGVGRSPLRIDFPSAWTAASITFQVSYDNDVWVDLYDDTGEVEFSTADASVGVILPDAMFRSVRRLKVRSGTSGTPVAQAAERELKITVE